MFMGRFKSVSRRRGRPPKGPTSVYSILIVSLRLPYAGASILGAGDPTCRVAANFELTPDREKFSSGIATFNDIINDQRALVVAQISEVNALAAYAHARVSLDQTLGETLERNHVSLEEGLSGRVARESLASDVVAGGKE